MRHVRNVILILSLSKDEDDGHSLAISWFDKLTMRSPPKRNP